MSDFFKFYFGVRFLKFWFHWRKDPCVDLLANVNGAAANMGQSVICVWDGWAFVWQEGLRNRSCWQHVGAGAEGWENGLDHRERDSEVTTAHCVSPRWAERVNLPPGDWGHEFILRDHLRKETFFILLLWSAWSNIWDVTDIKRNSRVQSPFSTNSSLYHGRNDRSMRWNC